MGAVLEKLKEIEEEKRRKEGKEIHRKR